MTQKKLNQIRAILFDAGNTLIFPRIDLVASVLSGLGYPASVEEFYRAERTGKQELDQWLWPLLRAGAVPDRADYYYWKQYLRALVQNAGVPDDTQVEVGLRLAEEFKQMEIWSRVLPGTEAVLDRLRQRGYLLGVISNSLGMIESQLARVNLARHFEFIIDSHFVGVEKPHARIFLLGVERCGCDPADAIFVGDLYSTDVGGAQNAGLRGVLLDWVGAYPHAESPRITSLAELEGLL